MPTWVKILKKLLNKEALATVLKALPEGTLEASEVTALNALDLEAELKTATDGSAAGTRKELEAKHQKALDEVTAERDALKKAADDKAAEGQTAEERMQATLDAMQKRIDDQDAALETAKQDAAQEKRKSTISTLFNSVPLLEGLDPDMARGSFEAALADIGDADLGNESLVKPLVDGWKEKNPAIIRDTSGGGSGGTPKGGSTTPSGQGAGGGEGPTMDDRAKALQDKGLLPKPPAA